MNDMDMKIGILDLKMGNIASVMNAIEYCGYDTEIIDYRDADTQLCDQSHVSHLIIPGVGHYQQAMARIQKSKLKSALMTWVDNDRPLLGICLGMQLLCEASEECVNEIELNQPIKKSQTGIIETSRGLGIIPGTIKKLNGRFRLPHIGWNRVDFCKQHPILNQLKSDKDYYFVHSYALMNSIPDITLATTDYNHQFSSMIAYKSAIGIQFHPEKSQRNGLQILENFCHWQGVAA